MALNLQHLKVLVAEDSMHMRSLVFGFLKALGITKVAGAKDADEAWEKIGQFNPDILIVDWNMPPTSGLDLVKKLRRDEKSPNRFLPCLMMTAYSEEHRVGAARDGGVSAFLVKPMSAQSFIDKFMTVVEDDRPFIDSGVYFGPDRRRPVRDLGYRGQERRKDG